MPGYVFPALLTVDGEWWIKRKKSEVSQVVEVSIEVSSGAARFHVAVRAESIQRVATIVAARHPGADCRVKFPIDPEGFFVKEPTPRAETVEIDQPDPIAA
jgi:hypothetical protein